MANKMYQVRTQSGQVRYATGRTKNEALAHYLNAHLNSVVISIVLLTF